MVSLAGRFEAISTEYSSGSQRNEIPLNVAPDPEMLTTLNVSLVWSDFGRVIVEDVYECFVAEEEGLTEGAGHCLSMRRSRLSGQFLSCPYNIRNVCPPC